MPNNRMLTKREVATYASTLLEATQVAGSTFEVAGQFADLQRIVRSHPGLREVLTDETIDEQARASVIGEVFKDFDPALVKVFTILVERRELSLLHRVVEEFNTIAEDALDAVFLDVTTVVELDDGLRKQIKDKFAAQFGKDIMLREHIDPSILGGIILGAHGKRIDASVSTQLEKTRVALSSVTTGGER